MTHVVKHSSAGEGTELCTLDATTTVKIGAKDTDGTYELFEVDAPRGPTVPLHRDPWGRAFYVLHGRMTVQVDDGDYDLGPGSSITVPPDSAHTFTPITTSVKFLAFSLGDALGRFFADLHQTVPAGRPLEEVVPLVLEVAERHGMTFAGVPALGDGP